MNKAEIENGAICILGLFSEQINTMKENIFTKSINDINIKDDIYERCSNLIITFETNFLHKDKNLDRIFYSLNSLYEQTKIELLEYIIGCKNMYEKTLYNIFDKNINKIFNNLAIVIKRKNNSKNIPDRWIKYNKFEIPIEFKRHNFDNKAKLQLRRYIDTYGAKMGIAIGKQLKVKLDKDMLFISIDEMNNCSEFISNRIVDSTGQIISNKNKEIENLKNKSEEDVANV